MGLEAGVGSRSFVVRVDMQTGSGEANLVVIDEPPSLRACFRRMKRTTLQMAL